MADLHFRYKNPHCSFRHSPLYEDKRITFEEVGQFFEEQTLEMPLFMAQETKNIEKDSSYLEDDGNGGSEQSIMDQFALDCPNDCWDENQNELGTIICWDENQNELGASTALPPCVPQAPFISTVPVARHVPQTNLTTTVSQPVKQSVKQENTDSSAKTRRGGNDKTSRKRSRSNSNSDQEPPAKAKRDDSHAPNSRNKEDVLNYMVEHPGLNFVVSLTKIKPKKGKASPNGQYWEIENIAEDYSNETITMRTGNKGNNDNGSSNRILYAFYCRFPIEITAPKSQNVSLRLKEHETGRYEDKDKVKIDEIKIYQCKDVPQFFAYIKARIDLSQDFSKSRIHSIEFLYEDKLLQKSKKCKFVSGKSNSAILSNQSPSQDMNWKKHIIQEFKENN